MPAGRRRELLANLSERVQARRNELHGGERVQGRRNGWRGGERLKAGRNEARRPAEPSNLVELFGAEDQYSGPHERDVRHPNGAEHAAAPLPLAAGEEADRPPARRIGALAWVLVVAASMLVMCVAAALTFVFLLVRANLD